MRKQSILPLTIPPREAKPSANGKGSYVVVDEKDKLKLVHCPMGKRA
jgi:hypothetical protein